MESVRVDPWLTAWRASCIIDGEMKLLKTSLEKQAKAVDNEAKIAGSRVHPMETGEQALSRFLFLAPILPTD